MIEWQIVHFAKVKTPTAFRHPREDVISHSWITIHKIGGIIFVYG